MIFRRKSNIHQKLRFEYWCSQPRVKDSGRQLGTWRRVAVGNGSSKLRVIRTARDLISINEALQEGYIPLFKMKRKHFPPETNFIVCQHKKTGEIIHFEPKNGRKIGVWRAKMKWFERLKSYFLLSKNKHQKKPGISEEWEVLFEGTSNFPSYPAFPYAAYLIPKDIKIDEMVYIEDYIEPQWDGIYKFTSGIAIWTGKDLRVIPRWPLLEFDVVG